MHINTGIARTKLGHVLLEEKQYHAGEVESQAGYDILIKQIAANASWLMNARKDLVEEYAALNIPGQAQHFREELASFDASPVPTRAK
jgi:serine/threonine-protein kinase